MLSQQEKKNQVYEVLVTPIICCKGYKGIFREGDKIYSGQEYKGEADEDMSDFTIGYYKIIYRDLLKGNSILSVKNCNNKEFAGDTMNSFNTIANQTPGAGKTKNQRTPEIEWSQELVEYKNFYHCLANFWLLPMDIGRTLKGGGELNKAKSPISDYVDRFLKMVNTNVKFERSERQYFCNFKDWPDFVDKHFLYEAYVTEELRVIEYSQDESTIIKKAMENIKLRANQIAQSKYVDELWDYFHKLNILNIGL